MAEDWRSIPCKLWTKARHPRGYGQVRVGGRLYLTHRYAYEQAYGPLPSGAWVLHRCDVRNCYEPVHLFLGNNEANVADMVNKGRQPKREGHGSARLTSEDIAAIRTARSAGETAASLGRRYGVHNSHISRICRGLRWR